MQISSRFSVGVHVLTLLATNPPGGLLTSDRMADSVNTNPVVIRRILGQLKKAGLVEVRAAAGGTYLRRDPATITLLDVYRAVDVVEEHLFSIHEKPNPHCLVGRNIQASLDGVLGRAQTALEQELAATTLAQVVASVHEPAS